RCHLVHPGRVETRDPQREEGVKGERLVSASHRGGRVLSEPGRVGDPAHHRAESTDQRRTEVRLRAEEGLRLDRLVRRFHVFVDSHAHYSTGPRGPMSALRDDLYET